MEDFEDNGPSLDDVLEQLIAGEPVSAECPFQFAVAVELLYRKFGLLLSADNFSSMRFDWAKRVDEAIKQVGVPEENFGLLRHLFNRGPAIPFAGQVEMSMGYLSLLEVRPAIEAFDRADFSGLELDLRKAVAEVRSWLISCDTMNRDLVGFYSG